MSEQQEFADLEQFPLGEILNLSVTEILALQFLIRYQTPIIRITLLESINSIVASPKPIASSSFYLKLKRMEENGFVTRDDEDRFSVTLKGRNIINELQRLTTLATMDEFTLTQEFLPVFIEKAKIPSDIGRMVIVNLEHGFDLRLIERIAQFSSRPYLLTEDKIFKSYQNMGMSDSIQRCHIIENKISIPDEFFDAVVVIGYGRDESIYGATNFEWLLESVRISKIGGIVVVISLAEPPKVGNFIIDSVVENLKYCNEFHDMNESQLIHDMEISGISDPQIFDHKGLMLGYGHK